ncbi:TadE/TadG family type IV pilus assembly protein [Nocardioides marmoribigeumensis]|uniref:Flp pilus assembly protein TadG n=1 Tax=Nocardioides marmoribigeumensis TaxID=433649 RepID=A0ABU2BXI8_9ACTN|nr:pilus assembly protein [Nocardioides marmoribigeumensis]MDR7363124.1 Flp pilus assembly protein TadG [Nocardioides marmoribigeumensis]
MRPGRRTPHARTESGASALELSFLAPGLIFLIFLVIQAGLFFYGRTVAIQAAREGVSQLRLAQTRDVYDDIRRDVKRNTESYALSVGREALLSPVATSSYDEGAGRVTMDVQGEVITLVPGLQLRATAHAEGAVERFEPDQAAP